LEGSFEEQEGILVFKAAQKIYHLEFDRYSTAIKFVVATGVGEPSAAIRAFHLDNERLAVCRAKEIFSLEPQTIDDCP
jgi:hypothetical protein